MGASEIKAGGAYVELGGKSDKLDAAFAQAGKSLAAFGSQVAIVGASLAALGGAAVAPLLQAAKSFADHAEELSKVSARTGFSTEFVSGMEYAAEASGLSAKAITAAMKTMGKSMAKGSDESPEEAFLRLADGIAKIEDPTARSQQAIESFGKAGIELLPILEDGAAGLRKMANEDKLLGAMSKETVEQGNRLDIAFDRLARAGKNLADQIGSAITPTLGPLLDMLIDFTVWANQTIDQNPELVESIFQIALGFVAMGTALAGVGALLLALSSPIVLAVGGIFLVLGSLLAVTDQLGVTKTGFGDLWNSVKIGGKGLADWLTALWKTVTGSFEILTNGFKAAWFGAQALMTRGLQSLLDGVISAVNGIIGAWNKLASVANLPILGKVDASIVSNALGRSADYFGNKSSESAYKAMNAGLGISGALSSGIDTSKGAVGFDIESALSGLKTMGNGVFETMSGLLEKLLGSLGVKHIDFPDVAKGPGRDASGALKYGSVGSFSSYVGANQVGGGDVQMKQLDVLRQIARNTSGRDVGSVLLE